MEMVWWMVKWGDGMWEMVRINMMKMWQLQDPTCFLLTILHIEHTYVEASPACIFLMQLKLNNNVVSPENNRLFHTQL